MQSSALIPQENPAITLENAQIATIVQQMVDTSQRNGRPLSATCKAAVKRFFDSLHDSASTVATMYGYLAVYALLVNGPDRALFNIAYFTPVLGTLLAHYLPLQPQNRKKYLQNLQKALLAAMNASFISSAGQQLLFLAAKGASKNALIAGVSVIMVGTTLISIPCAYYDYQMQAGQRYSPVAEGFIKFVMRPLQTASPFFPSIFVEHLHDAPAWMPTVVGGGLGVMRLAYEILLYNCEESTARRMERFFQVIIQDGILNGLSTSSIIFTIVISLYVVQTHLAVPDGLFAGMAAAASALWALSIANSVAHYRNHDAANDHASAETQHLLANAVEYSPATESDNEGSAPASPVSAHSIFATTRQAVMTIEYDTVQFEPAPINHNLNSIN